MKITASNKGALQFAYSNPHLVAKEQGNRHTIRVTYDNHDTTLTEINGTVDSVLDYYIGKQFNLGTDSDKIVTAVKVAFFDGEVFLTHKRQYVAPIKLIYDSSDNGNCRVYYRAATPITPGGRKGLYCMQIEDYRQKTFTLLTCSQDGEPECYAGANYIIPKAEGDEPIDRELNQFLNHDFR